LKQLLKEEHITDNSFIIMLSNMERKSGIDQAKQVGADGYIVKATTTPDEIVNKVIESLEK